MEERVRCQNFRHLGMDEGSSCDKTNGNVLTPTFILISVRVIELCLQEKGSGYIK